MPCDLARYPLRKHRARQVGLREKVKPENALEFRLTRARERMQPAPARVPQHRVEIGKLFERCIDYSGQHSRVCYVDGMVDKRIAGDLPFLQQGKRLVRLFEVKEN